MKVILDTNIAIDILEHREPYYEKSNEIFLLAINNEIEDAIVAATAARENADYIITKNTKDYVNSPVTAITPADFLKNVRP